jgi:drug/metabolite transporter (DMT)-like permease
LLVGVIGTMILSCGMDWTANEVQWGAGEWLTLLSSVAFAIEILMLDRLARQVDSAHITPAFLLAALAGAAGVGVSTSLFQGTAADSARWAVTVLADPLMLRDVLLLGFLATALAFTWMNQYQPRVSATRAALIYLLEPLFATAFAVLGGYDSLSVRLIVGGGLILAGNAMVELPRWAPRRKPRQYESSPSFAQSARILDNTSGQPCIGP